MKLLNDLLNRASHALWRRPTLARWAIWRIAWWLKMHTRALWFGVVGLLIVVEAWAVGGLLRTMGAPPQLIVLLLWAALRACVWHALTGGDS